MESVGRNNDAGVKAVEYDVALRMESVGRNWRVWVCPNVGGVALRMESVGRNCHGDLTDADFRRRSPHGERG